MNSDLKELQDNLNKRFDGVRSHIEDVEANLSAKIAGVEDKLTAKIGDVDNKVDELGRRVGVLKKAVEHGREQPRR